MPQNFFCKSVYIPTRRGRVATVDDILMEQETKMNKLTKIDPSQINPRYVPNLIAVESTTPEGHPVTIGTIIRNKYGRVNFTSPGHTAFYAGSKSSRDVQKYAKTFDVWTNGDRRVFIDHGQAYEV